MVLLDFAQKRLPYPIYNGGSRRQYSRDIVIGMVLSATAICFAVAGSIPY
jgi:hypothetical protein